MTAIYARQSVDKKDSISIDTQIEACMRIIPRNSSYRTYSDKGWSGKNIDRPQFQQLLSDIRSGVIDKIVVYKLDRISRSLHDFSNLMELFKENNVEFASTVETFDTSTPIGRAMLGIIMVFAELERENILLRVKDNYYARGEKGLYLGGQPIYGFDKLPTKLEGIKTSVLVPNNHIHTIEYMYSAYQNGSSLGEIAKQLNTQGNKSPNGSLWDSCKISRLLRSPTYVCADVEVYKYYKQRGCKISSPIEAFTGEYGCFLYGKRASNERKYTNVKDHTLSLGLHNGVISSELWLDVQRKLDGNSQIKKGKSGTHSWLTGLVKCGKCGYSLRVMQGEYFYCSGKANHKICDGFLDKPYVSEIENTVKQLLFVKFDEIRNVELSINDSVTSPAANKLKIQLEALDSQIDNLVDRIAETNERIGELLEQKLNKLITEREELHRRLNTYYAENVSLSYSDILPLLEEFDDMPLSSKREIAGQFIQKILVYEEKLEILWRI